MSPLRGKNSRSDARDAALARGLRDRRGHGRADARVKGLGDDIIGAQLFGRDERRECVRGGELHGLVDIGRAHVERAAEDARKGQHIVDLVRIVAAAVVSTGRSDYPNQINNVLVFPGIFRGALDAQATDITEEMKLSAARAIASIVSDDELKEDYIIPGAFDKRVAPAVAKAVMDCAKASGISKLGK